MKKHNEGYSLVLVLVVLTVIGLISAFILTFSLNNLKNQQASVERMQARYKVVGEIEKTVATLNALHLKESESFDVPNATFLENQLTITVTDDAAAIRLDCVLELTGANMLQGSKEETLGDATVTTPVVKVSVDEDAECITCRYVAYEISTIVQTGEGAADD